MLRRIDFGKVAHYYYAIDANGLDSIAFGTTRQVLKSGIHSLLRL